MHLFISIDFNTFTLILIVDFKVIVQSSDCKIKGVCMMLEIMC